MTSHPSTLTAETAERRRDAADADMIRDIAEANRSILVETWIQDSPDLSVVIGDELLDDVEFIDAIRKICYAFDPARNVWYADVHAAARTIARLTREQVDRVHGTELVDDEERRMRG